jgi:hypothetical protein
MTLSGGRDIPAFERDYTMTNPTHETEAHKVERATDALMESAAKLGASLGTSEGSSYGARRVLAQNIRNNPEYGRGWHLLTKNNAKGNEIARFALVQCLQAAFVGAFSEAAQKKGMTEDAAKASAASAWSSLKNVHAKNIEKEEAAREAALAHQALIDAGEDVAAIEEAAKAERGAKARSDIMAGILKSASANMVAAMVIRAERDAMELDVDRTLDNVIASLNDVVFELGGETATQEATDKAKKKAKATAPIK